MSVALRSVGRGDTRVLTVPAFIARAIPLGACFDVELTDSGVLFRFVGMETGQRHAATAPTPKWAQDGKA